MSWFRLVFFATVAAALAAWLARSPEGGTCLECVLVTQEAGMEERGEHTLKVVTLNTWGLWLASKKRWRRMDCLGQYLSKTAAVGGALLQQHGSAAARYWEGLWAGCSRPRPPASRLPTGRSHTKQASPPIAGVQDVVVLQEVWVRDDVALLREHAARGPLRHAAHFQGGAIGAGLVVLSRHPILEVGPQAGVRPAAVCGRCPVLKANLMQERAGGCARGVRGRGCVWCAQHLLPAAQLLLALIAAGGVPPVCGKGRSSPRPQWGLLRRSVVAAWRPGACAAAAPLAEAPGT